MGKLLVFLLGLGAMGGAAYVYFGRPGVSASSTGSDRSQPAQLLDNARGAARRIEQDAEQRVRDTMQKTE